MRAEAIRRRLRSGETDSDDEEDVDESVDEAVVKMEYEVPATGARVSLESAKSLLFLYCSRLPTDM